MSAVQCTHATALHCLTVLHAEMVEENAVDIVGITELQREAHIRKVMLFCCTAKGRQTDAHTGTDTQAQITHQVNIEIGIGGLQIHLSAAGLAGEQPQAEVITLHTQQLRCHAHGHAHLCTDGKLQADRNLQHTVQQLDLYREAGALDGQDLNIIHILLQQLPVHTDQGFSVFAVQEGAGFAHHVFQGSGNAVHIRSSDVIFGINALDTLDPGEYFTEVRTGNHRKGAADAHIGANIHTCFHQNILDIREDPCPAGLDIQLRIR